MAKRMERWSVVTGVLALVFACCAANAQEEPANFSALSWSADGKFIAVGDVDGNVSAWSVEKKAFVWTYNGRSKPVFEVYFDSDRGAFLVVERGVDIVYLDEQSGAVQQRIGIDFREIDYKTPAKLRLANFDDNSGLLVAVGNLGKVAHVIDMRKVPKQPSVYVVTAGKMTTVLHPTVAPKKKVDQTSLTAFVFGGTSDPADIFDLALGNQDDEVPVEFAVCGSRQSIFAITKKGDVLGWDISKPSTVAPTFTREVSPLSPSGDIDTYLLGIGCDLQHHAIVTGFSRKYGDVQLWDTLDGTLSDFKIDAGPMISHGESFQSAGSLAVTSGDLGFTLWDASSDKLVRKAKVFHGVNDGPWIQTPNVVGFDPTQKTIAFVLRRQIYLWDTSKSTVSCITSDRCPEVTLSIEGQ
jgi:WD40 repeat protein